MTAVFLTIWMCYTLYVLFRILYGDEEGSGIAQAMQFVLVLLALRWAWISDVFNRSLWSPVDITAGVVLGHLIFVLSLWITTQHFSAVLSFIADWRGIVVFVTRTPNMFLRCVNIVAAEELIYRVAAQEMLLNVSNRPVFAIGGSAVCFCLIHEHFFRKGAQNILEFFLFSLTIGFLYYYTSSFVLVTVIHLIRNLESAYIDYLKLIDDGHDETDVLRLLNETHAFL